MCSLVVKMSYIKSSFRENQIKTPTTFVQTQKICASTFCTDAKSCVSTLLLFHQHVNERLCSYFPLNGPLGMAIPHEAHQVKAL